MAELKLIPCGTDLKGWEKFSKGNTTKYLEGHLQVDTKGSRSKSELLFRNVNTHQWTTHKVKNGISQRK